MSLTSAAATCPASFLRDARENKEADRGSQGE